MRYSGSALLLISAALFTTPADAQTLVYCFMGDSEFFGRRVAGLGDVNGDGFPDIGVVEPNDPMNPVPGYARVFSGLDGSLIAELLPEGHFFSLIERAGDVNGDGLDDVLLVDGGSLAAGGPITLVVRSVLSGAILASMPPGTPEALLGDADNDGCDDVLVTLAATPTQSPPFSGAIGLVSGSTGQLVYTVHGTVSFGFFGATYDLLGDVNGDGVHDFVVGEHGPSMLGQLQPGRVHVISGADGASIGVFDAPGQALNYGNSVASVADVDGDLVTDFLIHAPIGAQGIFATNPVGGLGQVYLHSGATGALLFTFNCPAFGCSFNSVIDGGCGDVDGDGRGDFSARDLLDLTGSAPTTVIFSGRTFEPLVTVPNLPFANINGGFSDGVGDLDGDDAAEMVFGTLGIAPPTFGGGAYVFSLAPANVTAHGAGSPGVDGRVPRIGSSGSVSPDGGLVVNLSSVPPDATAVLVVGLSETTWQGFALPLDISGSGALGAQLRVSPDLCLVTTTEAFGPLNAWASQDIDFPDDPALAGFTFHLQWVVLEPPASTPPFATSRALRVAFPN